MSYFRDDLYALDQDKGSSGSDTYNGDSGDDGDEAPLISPEEEDDLLSDDKSEDEEEYE